MGKTISIGTSGVRAAISEVGAELIRLQDPDGKDLLWDGDPAYWSGHAPLLFPIVGAVKDDVIKVLGQEYPMSRHGFARTSHFETTLATEEQCRFRLMANSETRRHFPFEFCLEIAYEIIGDGLCVVATATNEDTKPMPVSFGFHPAFRWPLPYGQSREAHEIRFEHSEGKPIRRLERGLLSPNGSPSPVQGTRLVLRDALFEDDAIIFDQLRSRHVTYGPPSGRSIAVSFPGMPHLGIWTKPGAPFVCVEPWQGFASPSSFDGEFADKPGTISLPPTSARTFTMHITALP